ncbi:Gfo/Idh/MocA family oxidoreductase [Microlunatus panaciterrae]|uniref:Dehydrogenase n=2 Tax=Microlunatus panaciterrae TaxID=400768 RepID=A0ABS2RF55_9ACTN|nr:putative dehydrogenase [Microlunatus panaciterrae]
MGEAHTRAYARVLHHYPGLVVSPQLVVVADEVPGRAAEAAGRYGFEVATTDWREAITRADVAAVSVTAPNFLHRQIGEAVAQAGRHLWIEKPVGLHLADAQAVEAALRRQRLHSAVGFNYRHAPAVQAARELIADGRLGSITHASFRLLSDYAAHPDGALTWRYELARAGRGVLADLASHGADLAWHLLGPITEVVADTAIFLPKRQRPTGATTGHVRATGGETGAVENEDYLAGLLRFASGARANIEVSRVAVGEQNTYGFSVHGTSGAVAWDFRRLGELLVSTGTRYQDQSFERVLVGPGHGDYAAFQPGSGIAMSFDDLKVIEAAQFLRSIAEDEVHGPSIADAVRAAAVVQALGESADSGRWVKIDT